MLKLLNLFLLVTNCLGKSVKKTDQEKGHVFFP